MKTNTAQVWDRLAMRTAKEKPVRRPGISLITEEELSVLRDERLDAEDVAAVCRVKAMFDGTIVR